MLRAYVESYKGVIHSAEFINGEQYSKEEVQCPHESAGVAPVTIYRTSKLVEKEWKNPKLLENVF